MFRGQTSPSPPEREGQLLKRCAEKQGEGEWGVSVLVGQLQTRLIALSATSRLCGFASRQACVDVDRTKPSCGGQMSS